MKKILLIFALIFMFILPVDAVGGTYTTNEYFYLPAYGAYGTDELAEYNAYMEIADNAIAANLVLGGDENIQDVAGGMFTSNTETGLAVTYQDADGTIDVVIEANDIVESMLKAVDTAADEDFFTYESTTGDFEWHSISDISDDIAADIAEGELANSIVVEADLKIVNTPNDEEIFTYEATTGDFEWHTLAELSIQPLEATLTDIADGTIAENLVNTTNPWADNEVSDDITITIADTTDSTSFPLLAETITGAQKVKSDAGLTYDASTGNLKSTQHGGIVEANLVDKSATEAITGAWTFSGTFIKSGTAALIIRRVDDDAADDPCLCFQRKRVTSTYEVQDDDELGHIGWYGWHTQYNLGATITAHVDGTPGDGDMPTRLEFSTSADASATPTLAMTIDSSQVVTFANALANGTTATTQSSSDNSTKLATTAYTDAAVGAAGGGDVSKVGTPADSQVGVWTGDGTIEGDASFTYDRSNLQITGDIGSTGTRITKGWFTDLQVTNDIAGSITGNAETVTFADNESTNENNLILFAGNAAGSGDCVVEADGDLHYNPSTGALTAKMHRVYMINESTALNAAWLQITSSVVTGDLTGLRTVMSTDAVSGGDAVSGVNVRGVYGQAIAEASAHAGLLQGGLFTASVAAGSVTAYNVHVLCGHYSTGASATIGGDLYVGYLRRQTREDNAESVTGSDSILAIENEAVQGDGGTVDVGIRIFDTNISGTVKGFTYGIDMTDAKIATADIRLSNGETIKNITDGVIAFDGDIDFNNKRLTEVATVEFNGLYAIGNSGSTETVDWQNGQYQSITISEACVISFSNPFTGTLTLHVTWSATAALTFDGGYTILEEGGTELVLSDTDTLVDIIKIYYYGTADTYVMGALIDVKD